ncbi:MAG TPA: MBL fold metallo-hydrolase [Actinomycetota bacterium]|jgi:glyoxylase-like metal-dependent hydrolase (beta-lactamase superfamily II)
MPAPDPETYVAAPGITGVDTWMAGRAWVTSAYLLHGSQPALVETGPTTSVEAVTAGLNSLGLGPEDLAHIVVTHIHLDHAGGVGTLSHHFPRATIWVHERGAPHLAEPSKLVSSATRVYGEERLRELFGPVEAVPAERLRAVSEGDRIDLADRSLEVLYTPGHASHHVALVDSLSGAVFTGDALGIHLPDVRVLRPATPPPDIDVELGVQSIERIHQRAESLLLFSHFGPVTEVDELCDIAARRLRKWADIVRDALEETDDLDRVTELLERKTADEFASAEVADRERYEILSGMKVNASGLVRYWRKRAQAEAETSGERHVSAGGSGI